MVIPQARWKERLSAQDAPRIFQASPKRSLEDRELLFVHESDISQLNALKRGFDILASFFQLLIAIRCRCTRLLYELFEHIGA